MPPADVYLSVDVGTSSTKGVLVALDGSILGTAVRQHRVSTPRPGWFEMDAHVWWDEFVSISRELLDAHGAPPSAVGVSGMGPCVALADAQGNPLRPAILYGVDTRSGEQIRRLTERFGAEDIRARGGSSLTSQAAGPKIAWVADAEPDIFVAARRFHMPSSWLVHCLTGEYVLDHHSASQCSPLYDSTRLDWYRPWADEICPGIELPSLRWAGDVAGAVHTDAAEATGIPIGTPVITGTIDAWAEAISVGAQGVGDLMLMYGTTMFLIHTVREPLTDPSLWGTVGALPGTRNLAGGMATSGAITGWMRELFGEPDYETLTREAASAGPGANGLLLLPYFAGERTPILDPRARGLVAGLTLSHTRGDLYRAALEAVGFGVRHNIAAMERAGGDVRRVVAVGGGTTGGLWTQVVSDITGRAQEVRQHTIGASYGGAFLAASTTGTLSIDDWNPVDHVVQPDPDTAQLYDGLFADYLDLYRSTREVSHHLASLQHR